MNRFLLIIVLVTCRTTWGAPKKQRIGKPEEWLWCESKPAKDEKQKRAEAKLGEHLKELYKKNRLSASETQDLLQKARNVGLEFKNPVKGCNRQEFEEKPEEGTETHNKNAARTLIRNLRKHSLWGPLYWAKVPVNNPKTKQVEECSLPFLLPHEWLADYLRQPGAFEEAMPETGTYESQELAKVCKAWKTPEGSMLPLGLHGDGVPIQGRMNQSTLDFFTMNLPCSDKQCAKRMPVCCLEAKWHAGPETTKAICKVIAWSLENLGHGFYPCKRHDGIDFDKSLDKARIQLAGKPMPGKAALLVMRSDWDWNSKWYGAPAPNQKSGCCWLCKAKPDNWKAMTQADRLSAVFEKPDEWLQSLEERGKALNPLLELPGVSTFTLKPDWMHVVDEGCAALAAGQILWEIVDCYEASTREGRVDLLWKHIQEIYKANNWPAKKTLKKLTLKDFKKPGKAAELDVKAADCRYFQPILESLTKAHGFHCGTKRQKAIHNVAHYIGKMYAALEDGNCKEIASNGFKFCQQYMALEEFATKQDPEDTHTFRVRPKLHLLQHILDKACRGCNPKNEWAYKDETFGYRIQSLWFKRTSNANANPHYESERILLRWMNEESFLSMDLAASSSKG